MYVEQQPLETAANYPRPPTPSLDIPDCMYDPSLGLVKVLDILNVSPNKPDEIKAALQSGPVAATVQADGFAFQFYSGGIISSNCGTIPNHDVLIVGFGK